MRVGRFMDITPERGGTAATTPTDQVKYAEDLSTDEVRQGVTGHGVRYVLGVSLAAALIGLALAWIYVV